MRSRNPTSRPLHPLAWWAWAAGLAVGCLLTTNPLLLGLIAGVIVFVVASKRTSGPWAGSFAIFARLAVVVVVSRVAIEILFGQRLGGHTLFVLPRAYLPGWAAGVSIGGPVTTEAFLQALWQGVRLAVLLLCFGAANSLSSPYRLLRCLPAFLYEAGVAVTVALSLTPEVAATIIGLRRARRLRGRPVRGVAGLRGMAIPVLTGAMDRSLHLAESMDSRGFGRRAEISRRTRWLTEGIAATGLITATAGLYWTFVGGSGNIDAGISLVAGGALLVASMVLAGRRNPRTRYRPDPWRFPEWLTTSVGALAIVAFANATGGLQAAVDSLTIPVLPVQPALAVLACALPGLVTARPVAGLTARRPGRISPSVTALKGVAVEGPAVAPKAGSR